MMNYDVIIVGAGSMGMAAGYYLTLEGKSVLLLDSFNPPHDRGAHHGDTRIIRHAYGEGTSYVPLALRAQKLWFDLERESGRKLFYQTGVLNVGTRDSTFIQQVVSSSEAYSLPLQTVDSSKIHTLWPGISLPEGYVGCFESNSGVLKSEECIRAYRELLERHQVTILTNSSVQELSIDSDGVTVQTADESYKGRALIVTAGAWSSKLLPLMNIHPPLVTKRKTFAWFEADDFLFGEKRFPAFTFETSLGHYYGFPSMGGAGLKVGRHDGGLRIHPDEAIPEFGALQEDEEDLRMFLSRFMPLANTELRMGKTCTYTLTPDENFIIDAHPEYPHIVFAAGFSGHGFKFSSVVGEILSQLITTGKSEYDISLFSMNRFK
ncbi:MULTISPECIES: N-methyl-L-tryptophan oxidase [unclassified Paenibacillus]|uniref:N-methyl-L-tryptophan oxidase n=1 Tax=unclassified Paenibacillus TaxID=185978 RepID=UPI00070BD1FE|nr:MULTISPECIES: N-methyl-L-tryptophan oxidase [unclassified Paenibacillus]KQX46746.1 methyltryptophan oxidase [Paenibacillus sp. Root444D2]KRE34192.1 methyltryptophan oxidase [Paenibacillus sp. Soil724D2]